MQRIKGVMMFNIGTPELIVIFIVALIVFGPHRLPELGRTIGKIAAELRKGFQDFKQSLEQESGENSAKDVKKKIDEDKGYNG